ncbi:MAG: hypothetical protein R3A80_08525 [Bdellovibrionota bacterium]
MGYIVPMKQCVIRFFHLLSVLGFVFLVASPQGARAQSFSAYMNLEVSQESPSDELDDELMANTYRSPPVGVCVSQKVCEGYYCGLSEPCIFTPSSECSDELGYCGFQ